MSAVRYSGDLRIRLESTHSRLRPEYRCVISRRDGNKYSRITTEYVGVAPSAWLAADSPAMIDSVAHAALSFAEHQAFDISSHAAVTDRGWHIGRSPANAWPKENNQPSS